VVSPLSLIITAFAPVDDVRKTLTPQLRTSIRGDTELLLLDLGKEEPPRRLGLAQAYNATGEHAPDADAALLKGFFAAVQKLNRDGLLLAYHDRSDGGLFATPAKWPSPSRGAACRSTSTRCATTR
jgi:phosphoribosylformylglycinamidine synthase